MTRTIIEGFGEPDIAINSASIDRFGTVDDPARDESVPEHHPGVANIGSRALPRAASKVTGEGGRFVFVASNPGSRAGAAGLPDRASIKAAIDSHARGAARDPADKGITANGVLRRSAHPSRVGRLGRGSPLPQRLQLCRSTMPLLAPVYLPLLSVILPLTST